ncbi:TIGR00299 family protein [candidate division WOR-3 bacterium RBG_13_43_14]|uniref:TIGR00299 family protein n=1 Tax=candidate division WOR-3 bacterium RBG_13_43_14 TaxID=1802590 RepID=A0A1F4U3W9_UNCW3|nr:MAG: TIGR00299 family protein [candidate division WOR-3 bacterium RBG_13_43_14]
MKAILFDPIPGTSGDMIVAAMLDAGVPIKYLKEKLKFIPGADLHAKKIRTKGVLATRLSFTIKKQIPVSNFINLVKKSALPPNQKTLIRATLERILEVEKIVHGANHLHLHELADLDTLLDISGAIIGLDYFKVERVLSRPLKAGTGFIRTQEGKMPAFNFATSRLLKAWPVDFLPIEAELTTPTGAAIITTVAKPTQNIGFSKIRNIGLGTGAMTLPDQPNLLRIFIGEISNDYQDECQVIETNIDDMNPQDYEAVIEKLYDAGAYEVFLTPVIMKNSRPGILLTVLSELNNKSMIDLIFSETTTLGIRIRRSQRYILPRQIIRVTTDAGTVRVKVTCFEKRQRYSIEYRDLKNIARKTGKSIDQLRKELDPAIRSKIRAISNER